MTTPNPPQSRSSGNVFTRKVGPMPMWGWMGVVLLAAIGYYLIRKQGQTTAAANQAVNTPGGVDSSLVPQFVNQTYVQDTPPAAPQLTPTKTSTVHAYSWTDTGQKWSPVQLAKALGVNINALKPANAAAKKALTEPNRPIPKGAKFTYLKEPKDVTTSG